MNLLKSFLAFLFCFLTHSSILYSQSNQLEWINRNAYELATDSASGSNDLRFLSKILKGKTVVGLGEASHGTQEFFFQKRRIVEYLVSKEKYRLLAFEAPRAAIEEIDQYIQTGIGDVKSIFHSMGLYNADEIYRLCRWLRFFNESRSKNDKVRVTGFDDEAYWSNPYTRDERMAQSFIQVHRQDNRKAILWAHNMHLAKDTTMAQYKAMGFHLKKQYENRYFMIGFDTYSGSVNVLNFGMFEQHDFTATENSFSAVFNKANYHTFFIDLTRSGNPFLGTQNFITNLYSDWREPRKLPIIPGSDFDALIFVRKSTASKRVE